MGCESTTTSDALHNRENQEVASQESPNTSTLEYPEVEAGDMPRTRSVVTMKMVMDQFYAIVADQNQDLAIILSSTDNELSITGEHEDILSFYEKIDMYLDTVREESLYEFNDDVIKEERRRRKKFYHGKFTFSTNKLTTYYYNSYGDASSYSQSGFSQQKLKWMSIRTVRFKYPSSARARLRGHRSRLQWHYNLGISTKTLCSSGKGTNEGDWWFETINPNLANIDFRAYNRPNIGDWPSKN